MTHSILFLGFGYTASFTAPLFKEVGLNIYATQRALSSKNLPSYVETFRWPTQESLPKNITYIICSAPPTGGKDPFVEWIKRQDLSHLKGFIYLSATSVYGNHHGEWVTEDSPLLTQSERGLERLQAENDWAAAFQDIVPQFNILRLSGIYGPGRSSINDIINQTAKRIYKPEHYFSRIHVKDIAGIILKSFTEGLPSGIYNLADDLPAPSHEVVEYAAKLLKVAPPPLTPYKEALLSPMAQEFYADNKKVSNIKLKSALNLPLLYPSYKEGLDAILKEIDQEKS